MGRNFMKRFVTKEKNKKLREFLGAFEGIKIEKGDKKRDTLR
jgi:hypothetical protein